LQRMGLLRRVIFFQQSQLLQTRAWLECPFAEDLNVTLQVMTFKPSS